MLAHSVFRRRKNSMMLIYTAVMLLLVIVATSSAQEPQFKDCSAATDSVTVRVNSGKPNATMKCCEDFRLPKGCECYDISAKSGYNNSWKNLPQCPFEKNFGNILIYTRTTGKTAYPITSGQLGIPGTNYNGTKKTVFITYGYIDTVTIPWYIELKDALLDKEDINVIFVDWKVDPTGTSDQITANVRVIGSMVAVLIVDMNKLAGASFENFHLIGHSTGAHIMGIVGKEVFRLTNKKVGRISGLDPYGSNFEGFSKYVRIDSTDALFVDVIHTNALSLFDGGFGMRGSFATVDFYANGGARQPLCPKILMYGFNEGTLCSHRRAVEYFINSISKCSYVPQDGNTACKMGYYVSSSCSGNVTITTTDVAPYC